MALFEDKEENIEKIDQGIGNLSLSQSDSPLVHILSSLFKDEKRVPILRPNINITNTSTANNICTQGNDTSVSLSQLVDKLENEVSPPVTSKRIKGYFCSDNVFNLSKKVLSEIEIKVLEKGLGFVPTPNIINEEDLRRDFGEFSRKMRCKWYFRDEPSPNFSEVPAFRPKSNWKPPPGHPCVELFLSKLESELFSFMTGKPQTYNLTKEERLAMRSRA